MFPVSCFIYLDLGSSFILPVVGPVINRPVLHSAFAGMTPWGRSLCVPLPAVTCLSLFYILIHSQVSVRFAAENPRPQETFFPSFHHDFSPEMTSGATTALLPIDLEREIQAGIEYAKSIKNKKRKLVFFHIPKTAGTTIEEVGGLQAKLAWGSCLFHHYPKRSGGVCRYPPGQFEWPTRIGYWHLPPQLFPLKGVNPYHGADLFAVVRDPYDRMLSEFYYICRRKITVFWNYVDCNRTRLQEPEYMNDWLQHKLDQLPKGQMLSPKDYLNYNGHFTPQSDFLVSFPAQVRMVDYVLNMDNLQEEFNTLMKAYGISVIMPDYKKNAARDDVVDLHADHMDTTTLGLLRQHYHHDVAIFNNRTLP